MKVNQIKKMITNNKEDKLIYEKESGIFTFKTETYNSTGYIASCIRHVFEQYEPEILEFYNSTKTYEPKIVTIKFVLKNKKGIQNE